MNQASTMKANLRLFRWLFVVLVVTVGVTHAASGTVSIDPATITHSSMTVKWQYSPPNKWSVESYVVCWKKAGTLSATCGSGGLGLSPKTIVSSATEGSYSVTDLPDANEKYKFKVKANIVKNSNSNKKKTKKVGTEKQFTAETPATADDCPTFGALGHLYAEPSGETTMKLTWNFLPDCEDWSSPINSMTICWERKGNLKAICDSNEGTITDPGLATGYNVDGLKPCKRYRFKLWGNYQTAVREIGTTTMRTHCPPKMMMTDNSDCAEEGVSLCLPALNEDIATFEDLQEQLAEPIFRDITGILKAPSANFQGILRGVIEGEVVSAVEMSAVYKNLKVENVASRWRNKRALRKLHDDTCKVAEEQDPLTKEEIREVARISYFLRDAVDFIVDDLAVAIDEELYADLAYAVDREFECGVKDPCETPSRNPPNATCLQSVPEIAKDEVAGDIADAVEDLYDRFDTSDCNTECTAITLQDVLLVQMMEGEVSEGGCPKMGVISNRGPTASSLLATGRLSNLFEEDHQ